MLVNYNFVNDPVEKNMLESLLDNNLLTSVTDLVANFIGCCKGTWFAQMSFENKISSELYNNVDNISHLSYDTQTNELRSVNIVYFDSRTTIKNTTNYDCVINNSDVEIKVDLYKLDKKLTDTFEIFVKTLTGCTITIYANSNTKISKIKRQIHTKERVMPYDQRLMFAGKLLIDDKSVSDYNISYSSTIHMILNARGGMHHESSSRNDYNDISCVNKKLSVYLLEYDIYVPITIKPDTSISDVQNYLSQLVK
jgi:hypothetical protein